jgi:signal transduction histidine kinase
MVCTRTKKIDSSLELNDINNVSNADNTENEALAQKLAKLESHLGKLEDQLIRSQRLAAMGTMASMIAHEFNNILTPIVSYAQYALKRNDDVELMQKALTKSFEGGKEAAEVCQQLLSFSRGESEENVADIADVVQTTLKCLVRNPAKDNIELQLNLTDDLVAAIEPCLLQQVLYNLLLNARDAMLGKRGRLKISTLLNEDNEIQIEVSDNGPGIEAGILARIFDPFFTTKNKADNTQGGSGLGLAVSKQILNKAGGSISVKSESATGTIFTITLPLVVLQ